MNVVLRTDYDEGTSTLVVTGDIGAVTSYPLVAAFVRSRRAVRISPTELRIPTDKGDIRPTYEALGRVLARYDIALSHMERLSDEMRRVKTDEDQFVEFSHAAASIWAGKFDQSDFSLFVDAVSKACPGRTFFGLQMVSAFHLAFSQHACNFSVPGAGKTSVVYAAYAYLRSLPEHDVKHLDHILVIGPLSSFKAWEDEYRDIFRTPARRKRLIGNLPDAERQSYLRGTAVDSFATELTLSSYQTLASLEGEFRTFLEFPRRRVMLVLDEAHNIKRPDGIWSSAALRLSAGAASRVVLTGTPVPNGYEDLANLFEFIHPKRRIVGYSGAALAAMSTGKMSDRVDDLKKRISPYYTRIRKRDLCLPGIQEEIVPVRLAGPHGEIYRYIEDLILPSIRKQRGPLYSRFVRARLMRLRQAASNPALLLRPLIDDDDGAVIDPGSFSVPDARMFNLIRTFSPARDFQKIRSLCRLVERLFEKHQRLLIWSVFVSNLTVVREALDSIGAQIDVISGATPVARDSDLPEDQEIETRERIIDRFLAATGKAILIANPQSVGESISLHRGCHAAIYYDRDFNAGRFIQSKDRIHRYGLSPDTTTEYYFLTVEGSVEEDIHARLAVKEQRVTRLVDEDDIPLFRLVLGDDEEGEDLRQILGSYERRKLP